jgi:opacity protein-like surface antigen
MGTKGKEWEMGRIDRLILYSSFALLLGSGTALAADMPETPYTPAPTPYEFGTGWYLRGDVGYKIYSAPHAHFDIAGYGDMINTSLSNTGIVGFGVGYKWNDWFRTDFTADYEWAGHFHGRLPCPAPCTGAPVQEFSDEFADISAWTMLINGYFDLPFFGEGAGGLTPYVGGGIGAAELWTSNVHFINPGGATGSWPNGDRWNFAWSLTAGVSYPITKNFLFDLNYRFVDLGSTISGPTLANFNNQPIHYDNIYANELRVGLRYLIN